jgi:hypothetical protein
VARKVASPDQMKFHEQTATLERSNEDNALVNRIHAETEWKLLDATFAVTLPKV